MQDIADRCGVSKVTVSRALRGDRRYVSEATTQRILTVARELGYDASLQQAARRLALRKVGRDVINQVIGLYFPAEFYQFNYFGLVFQGIMDAAVQEGYALVSMATYDSDHPAIPSILLRGDVDGIISLLPAKVFNDVLDKLRGDGNFGQRPVVSLVEPLEGCSSVVTNDYSGAYQSAAHLLGLGHRHMMHFVSPDIYPHSERLKAYRQAFADRRLDPDKHLHYADWYNDTLSADEVVLPVLRKHPEITAILGRSDVVAIKVRHTLSRIGLKVPEDISLTGFDDTDPLTDDQGNNILTTVRLPLRDIGRAGAELLIARITGKEARDSTITLPTEFVVRRSTAPPRLDK